MRLNKFLVVGCLMLGFPAASFSETFNQDDLFKVKSTQPAAGAFARTAAKIDSTLSQNKAFLSHSDLDVANSKIAKDQKNFKFYGERGQAHLDVQEYREAIADFSHALELKPDRGHAVRFILGRAGAKGCLSDDAGEVEDVDAAMKIGPPTANMFVMRANAFSNLKRYVDGISDANRAVQLDPDDARAYSIRAVLFMALGDSKSALKDCNRAISMGTHSAGVYEVRSIIYAKEGKVDLSKADLDTSKRFAKLYGY